MRQQVTFEMVVATQHGVLTLEDAAAINAAMANCYRCGNAATTGAIVDDVNTPMCEEHWRAHCREHVVYQKWKLTWRYNWLLEHWPEFLWGENPWPMSLDNYIKQTLDLSCIYTEKWRSEHE